MATDLSISGLASGFDWKTVVSQLADAERASESTWKKSQTTINNKNTAFGRIKTFLSTLQTDVQALKDAKLYSSRAVSVSDTAKASASVGNAAITGTFAFNISQLATSAKLQGTSDIGKAIAPDGDLTAVTVGSAGFGTAATAGTFTINGKQVTIATTDTLQQVFDKIATATSNAVTASYNSTTDKITLTSASEIVLGSATDTSNFLQVSQLYNNGSGSISSVSALGRVRLTDTLSSAKTSTAISDGGSGTGKFTINGVEITFNASADSVQNVLDRINNSNAGVVANYDSQNDRFLLTNKNTGDTGISLQDNTGNFLAATGLLGGTLAHGKNLLYTVNNGAQQISTSNTITEDSSNITGLSLTALDTGNVTVTVSSDTSKIKTAIQTFIKDYNTAQSYIQTQTASSTDANGKVTAGILAGDIDASKIATGLRTLSFSPISGLTGTLDQLASLGIKTNGKDNTITLDDSSALDNALATNLNSVQSLFADATNGWGTKLDTYLTNTVGDDGSLTKHQDSLSKQSSDITTQIANYEKTISADVATWTKAFQAMEQAQSQINQQLSYLSRAFSK